jgi:hypothetical protein
MMRFMRTTVTLDQDLEQKLRENALRTRRPFKRVLNEALRSALAADSAAEAAQPFVVKSRRMGLRTGHDPLAFSKLGDDLEAAAFVELTRGLRKRKP